MLQVGLCHHWLLRGALEYTSSERPIKTLWFTAKGKFPAEFAWAMTILIDILCFCLCYQSGRVRGFIFYGGWEGWAGFLELIFSATGSVYYAFRRGFNARANDTRNGVERRDEYEMPVSGAEIIAPMLPASGSLRVLGLRLFPVIISLLSLT